MSEYESLVRRWKQCIHSVGETTRVCITECMHKVLTTGSGIRNATYYLQQTELDACMREQWHNLYVDCGTWKHDRFGYTLLKEGVCTCDECVSGCRLAQHLLQLDDLLQNMLKNMMETQELIECPCWSHERRGFNPNCEHCKGKGTYLSKRNSWNYHRDMSTFLLCGILATGHTYDRVSEKCVCHDPTNCTACNGRGEILKRIVRRANADDIIPLLKEFDTGQVYDLQVHPRIDPNFVQWLRDQPKNELIILPAFRPMLSECC